MGGEEPLLKKHYMDIEKEIELYNQRVYGGKMQAHVKQTLRSKFMREQRAEELWGEFCNADIIRGYDDGEARP